MKSIVIGDAVSWLHEAPGDVGVIVCPGSCRDLRHSYRAMYKLAGMLSREGYPTLRLHYVNTGNSGDDLSKPLCDAWQDNIVDAIDWMQTSLGIDKIVLCGFRLGGLLAASVDDPRVVACVLIEPIPSGKRWLRELRALKTCQGTGHADAPGWFENEDVLLRPADLRAFETRSILHPRERPMKMLVLTNASGPELRRLQASSLHQNGRTTWRRSSLYETVVAPFEASAVPRQDFEAILTWLRTEAKPSHNRRARKRDGSPALHGEGWVEEAVTLTSTPAVRGVFSRPSGGAVAGEAAVIIGNLGCDPQFGVGRLHVELARRLATSGVAILRIDYLGLGDSDDLPGRQKALVYATPRAFEFRAAVDWLEARGFDNIGLAGHCSGAFHAFRATLLDPRVKFAVLINLLKLRWRVKGSYDGYLRSWQRHVDTAIWFSTKVLGFGPMRIVPPSAMRDLVKRGTRICFISGEDDRSRSDADNLFRSRGARRHGSLFKRIRVPETDHLISTARMRQRIIEAVVAEIGLLGKERTTAAVPAAIETSAASPSGVIVPAVI